MTAADIASKADITNVGQVTGTPPGHKTPITGTSNKVTVKVTPVVILAFTGAPQVEQDLILVGLLVGFGGPCCSAATRTADGAAAPDAVSGRGISRCTVADPRLNPAEGAPAFHPPRLSVVNVSVSRHAVTT